MHQIHIVDVFAERPYAGNPLAVVIGPPLDDEPRQRIAAEMNFSETTFLAPEADADGGYRVRIHTPSREIAFAGHPILGTAWVIRRAFAPAAREIALNLAVGAVPVRFETEGEREAAWFRAPAIAAGPACPPADMAHALGLAPEDVDADFPVRMMSAGTGAVMVPLRGRDALERARLDLDRYAPLAERGFPPLAYLFCRGPRDPGNDLAVRFFFEAHGVREDPATGNGAAFLGAWLLEHGYLGRGPLDLRIEQGHGLGRPSLVRLRAERGEGGDRIEVGGYVVAVLKGELA